MMKKLVIFLSLITFISVSFASVSHFHNDSATGTKATCPLCGFSHTIPVVPSTHTINLFSFVVKEEIYFEPAIAVVSLLLVLPDPRGPPSFLKAA